MENTLDQNVRHIRKSGSQKRPLAAEVLADSRDAILAEWMKRTRAEISSARNLERPILINTLPTFLDHLVEALSPEHSRTTATEGNNIAEEHGNERARLTAFDPAQVICEYQILRAVILDTLARSTVMTPDEYRVVVLSFDAAIRDSLTSYLLIQGQLREQFVATLTHDLRNPVGAIQICTDVINKVVERLPESGERAEIREMAQMIVLHSRRAEQLIDQLLDSARVMLGVGPELDMREHDFDQLLARVIQELPGDQRKRVKIFGKGVRGYWSEEHLRRALRGIIQNSFEHGGDGTVIRILMDQIDGRFIVRIHGEETSIPAEEQEMLFQVFTRPRGVGLAFVRSIAEAHGGSIGVDSAPERGTTFTLDIPIDARPFAGVPHL